jgi:hypothetical protein
MDEPMNVEGAAAIASNGLASVGASVGARNVGLPAGSWNEKIWSRLQAGPVAAVMIKLIYPLAMHRYAPARQRKHVRTAAPLGSWMVAEGIGLGGLDAARAVRMVPEDNERHRSIIRAMKMRCDRAIAFSAV